MIPAGHKANLDTIVRAANAGHLAVVECTDKASGKPTHVIAAMGWDGQEYVITPLAKLFDGNPYEVLDPPHA